MLFTEKECTIYAATIAIHMLLKHLTFSSIKAVPIIQWLMFGGCAWPKADMLVVDISLLLTFCTFS